MEGGLIIQTILLANVFILGVVTVLVVQYAGKHLRAKRETSATNHPKPQPIQPSAVMPPDVRRRLVADTEKQYHAVLARAAKQFEADLTVTTKQLHVSLSQLGNTMTQEEMKRYKQELQELRLTATKTMSRLTTSLREHQAELQRRLAERQTEIDTKLAEQHATLEAKVAARSTEIELELQAKQAAYVKKQLDIDARLTQHQTELEAALKEREVQIMQHQADIDNEFLERQKRHAARVAAMEDTLTQEMEARRHTLASQLDAKLGDTVAAFLTETLRHNVDLGAQLPYLLSQLEEHKDTIKEEVRR